MRQLTAAAEYIALLLMCIVCVCTARAQSLDLADEKVPLAAHVVRPSGAKFAQAETMMGVTLPPALLLSSAAKLVRNRSTNLLALEYSTYSTLLPPGAGTSDSLPRCTQSQVRSEAVLAPSDVLDYFDLVLYDYEDPDEQRRAELWPLPAAPYLEGDLYNPYRLEDRQQAAARLFDIHCLPTRFHFVKLGEARVMEYREGPSAWDRDGS